MTRTYGELRQARGLWGIQAEPHVLIRLKRLFPRADQSRAGVIILKDTAEIARDIEWFTARFPLRMADVTAAYLATRAERHRQTEADVQGILAGQRTFSEGFREPALPPRGYQIQPADIVLATGHLLLADDLGLGKSFSGLLVLRDPAALPALVVTLTHLPWQWLAELEKFFPWLRGHVVTSGQPYNPAMRRGSGGRSPDVLIMGYSKLAGWADHLAGAVNTVIFDEIQELRRGDASLKGQAAARVADKAAYRMGLSVGPDSTVELTGGPFRAGWVGRIADAAAMAAKAAPAERHGSHEVIRVDDLGIRSRGWTDDGFAWKPVRSFIQHPCTSEVTAIRSGSGELLLTGEHAVYGVGKTGLTLGRADAVRPGDRVAADDGHGWAEGPAEVPVDVIGVACALANPQVVVDISGVTRHDLGLTAWEWHNCHKEGIHGLRLPAAVYQRHAAILPEPAAAYLSAGRGGRRMAARLMLSAWAYMLGFYLGDGWVGGGRVCFAVEDSRAEAFADVIRNLPGLETDVKVRSMPGASVEVRFGHPIAAELIRRQLGGARCHEKAIPGAWITSWPETARRDLLRGLLDSDGSVARSGRRYYATTSKGLADSLLSLLRSLGIAGSVSIAQPGGGGTIDGRQIVGRRARYTVNWSAHAEAGDNSGWRGSRTRHEWARGRMHEAAVRRAGPAAATPEVVYDLEMDGHPSFVANGLLVHNSATPVFNYGGEIHNIMSILAPDALGDRAEFLREWGAAEYGMARGAMVRDPAALGTYLRDQGLLLRRTRKDVHRELPDPIEVEQPVDTDHATIDQVAADVAHTARILLGEVEATATERFQAAGDVDWRMRQATGIAKAAYVAEFAKLLLESEQRIVLFGWHRAVYDTWLERLAGYFPVLYTGTESPQQKARSAKAFMGGQSRILIMSLRSGAGLDGLQDWCSAAVFGELDWSPEVHRQCLGRLARDGQESTVVAYYMVSDDGTDPLMAEVLGIKKQQAEPIRDPEAALFTPLAPATDRARELAASVLSRIRGAA